MNLKQTAYVPSFNLTQRRFFLLSQCPCDRDKFQVCLTHLFDEINCTDNMAEQKATLLSE